MSGWIKLHRSLKDWQWYDDHNAVRLLIHLQITVNYEPKKWKGAVIHAGSRVFSWDKLSIETGLTKQQLRTAMVKLESSNEVTRQATANYQLVSLVKWGQMQEGQQEDNTLSNTQITGDQQADNRQITPSKEVKKERSKESKNNIESRKLKFADTLKPHLDVYGKDLLNDFFAYWTEPNKSGTKFKQELERTWSLKRRLETWARNDKNFNNGTKQATSTNSARSTQQQRQDYD